MRLAATVAMLLGACDGATTPAPIPDAGLTDLVPCVGWTPQVSINAQCEQPCQVKSMIGNPDPASHCLFRHIDLDEVCPADQVLGSDVSCCDIEFDLVVVKPCH